MLKDFEGRVAVVTGAANGIGRALAAGFAGEGMRVVLGDIDAAGAEAAAQAIGSSARAIPVDVSDEADVERFADACFDAFGQVDVLVNNAGVFQGGFMWERTRQDWDWTFGVNVFGIIHGVRHFVPRMIAQQTDGHVVNTASVAAFVAGPLSSPYVVSKCAALSLTECLAQDLGAAGARIGASVLTPSAFDTGIAHTAGVRPERFGRDDSADAEGTVAALAQMTGEGMEPERAVEPVLDAIRNDRFLIATRPSYTEQLKSRFEALLDRRMPPLIPVD